MFRNYLTVAIRNLTHQAGYAFINVAGLAIGIACCILILLYVHSELSYDQFHEKADRIYRVVRETRKKGGSAPEFRGFKTSGALASALEAEFPEIQHAVRWRTLYTEVRYESKSFTRNFSLVDPDFLNVFSFPLSKGDPETVFRDPYAILISETAAQTLFEDEDPLDKILTVEHKHFGGEYKITGVFKDVPENSTLVFDFLTATAAPGTRPFWDTWRREEGWRPAHTFILLPENFRLASLAQKLPAFMERHLGEEIAAHNTYHLQPLTRIYLDTAADYGVTYWYRDIQQIYLFSATALFILVIACINFMNLSTARSARRAREVGLRKVVGAARGQLIGQFLGEAMLFSLMALVLALGLVELVLPSFNAFAGKTLSLYANSTGSTIFLLLGVILFVGLLAGSYPAFYLSAFRPVQVLKGVWKVGSKEVWLRKGLVVFQFAISVFIIIGTVVIYRQLMYASNKNLGFDKENVVNLPIFYPDMVGKTDQETRLSARYKTVKQAFLQHPDVLKATAYRGFISAGKIFRKVRAEGVEDREFEIHFLEVDEDFLDTFEIELVAGRNFSEDVATDATDAFLINETAARAFGWEDPIGKQLEWMTAEWTGTVIGVVKDFHTRPLHTEIGPMALCMRRDMIANLGVRIRSDQLPATLAFLETQWQAFVPDHTFRFWFIDERWDQLYYREQRLGQLGGMFSLLAIFVSCLGLFGLAAFAAEQRTREIGIRKTLGASVSNILLLLSRDFVRWVIVANLIAWPIAFYAMNRWLQRFVYRIDLGVEVFVFGGLITLVIALFAVGYQAYKAAMTNPVDALKFE